MTYPPHEIVVLHYTATQDPHYLHTTKIWVDPETTMEEVFEVAVSYLNRNSHHNGGSTIDVLKTERMQCPDDHPATHHCMHVSHNTDHCYICGATRNLCGHCPICGKFPCECSNLRVL